MPEGDPAPPIDTAAAAAGRAEPLGARRLDLAARAAWLYHARNLRQDEIARALMLSRQVVQRLIALAASERLLRFQLVHPLADAIALADRLTDRFGLAFVEVVPGGGEVNDAVGAVAEGAALLLENVLAPTDPVIVGLGGRRVLREAALRVAPLHRPMHRLVSLMGNMTRDGRAGHYDVIMGLAERIGAQCYPLPMPVVTRTVAEREVLQSQTAFGACSALAAAADLVLTGIGPMHEGAPLHRDGFVTADELRGAIKAGAVGEMLGHCFDHRGELLAVEYHERVTSFDLPSPATRRTVIAQCGIERVAAIHAALTGRLADGLITDEATARQILQT